MKNKDYRWLRLPLVALSLVAFLAALWGGWLRLGWVWPLLQPTVPMAHGPLMVSGFLGTLIGVERAVALRKHWPYAGPIFSGIGGLLLVTGWVPTLAAALVTLGSFGLVLVFIAIVRTHMALYTLTMALGAVCWLIGNLLWLAGWPIFHLVLWWAGLLILTIGGERLELGRVRRLSKSAERWFIFTTGLLLAGLVISLIAPDLGTRIASLGMIAMTVWLWRFDIARHTVRQAGLPRFVAICLLAGFTWLGVAGLIGLAQGFIAGGAMYDAFLHAIFLGFVFSMIFGHAPIIFPAILGRNVTFHPFFYLPLALLHISLVMRVIGDLLSFRPARLWGGLINGIAILIFLATIAWSVIKSPRESPAISPPQA